MNPTENKIQAGLGFPTSSFWELKALRAPQSEAGGASAPSLLCQGSRVLPCPAGSSCFRIPGNLQMIQHSGSLILSFWMVLPALQSFCGYLTEMHSWIVSRMLWEPAIQAGKAPGTAHFQVQFISRKAKYKYLISIPETEVRHRLTTLIWKYPCWIL